MPPKSKCPPCEPTFESARVVIKAWASERSGGRINECTCLLVERIADCCGGDVLILRINIERPHRRPSAADVLGALRNPIPLVIKPAVAGTNRGRIPHAVSDAQAPLPVPVVCTVQVAASIRRDGHICGKDTIRNARLPNRGRTRGRDCT